MPFVKFSKEDRAMIALGIIPEYSVITPTKKQVLAAFCPEYISDDVLTSVANTTYILISGRWRVHSSNDDTAVHPIYTDALSSVFFDAVKTGKGRVAMFALPDDSPKIERRRPRGGR